ncbi:MAG TPA: hypothetical protein VH186_38445 [Chloroflexia bacterium]|nr:hypothetical protein [Chloroflexia bacterium]
MVGLVILGILFLVGTGLFLMLVVMGSGKLKQKKDLVEALEVDELEEQADYLRRWSSSHYKGTTSSSSI